MSTQLNPYLSFRDNARQAMEFYQSVFGGELSVNTFGDLHASDDPSDQDKVMHSSLASANGLTLMASDTPASMPVEQAAHSNISISLSGGDESELRGYWDKLSDGAQVTVPLEKAPWGDLFGMCTDKFGTAWMVNVTGEPQG